MVDLRLNARSNEGLDSTAPTYDPCGKHTGCEGNDPSPPESRPSID